MLLLDILLVTLIIVCIFYSLVLGRRIQDLQNSRVEFARMIKELNTSIVKAEHNVNEMSELSKNAGTKIKNMVEEASKKGNQLLEISEDAKKLAAKINDQIVSLRDISRSSKPAPETEELPNESYLNSFANQQPTESYSNQLKNFIQSIITKRSDDGLQLDQSGYYNTLRKISVKK